MYAAFYWIGVVLTLGCFALILAGNSELLYRFEHVGFPLSWTLAAMAILAFLAAESCHPAAETISEPDDEGSNPDIEWEAA